MSEGVEAVIQPAGSKALRSILVVEDEALIALDLKRRLERIGYLVPAVAQTADEAFNFAGSLLPDLILMDIHLKGKRDGIQAAEEVRDKLDIPVVFVTAHADPDTLRRAHAAHPFGYILKPVGSIDLHAQLESAHHQHQMQRNTPKSEE